MKSTRRDFIETSAAAGVLLASASAQTLNAQQTQIVVAVPTLRAKALMALFNLKYPIFEAPHGNATSPELAIAVSNAGAMGALSLTTRTPDVVRMSVSQIRAGTKGPFLVNDILRQEPTTLQIALDAGAPIVQFSWGRPTTQMVSAIRAAGAKFGVQVTSAESARTALDLGADYLACQGTEAGGHVQANRGLYEALPHVLKEAS
jgi:nitronate monooxygenase